MVLFPLSEHVINVIRPINDLIGLVEQIPYKTDNGPRYNSGSDPTKKIDRTKSESNCYQCAHVYLIPQEVLNVN